MRRVCVFGIAVYEVGGTMFDVNRATRENSCALVTYWKSSAWNSLILRALQKIFLGIGRVTTMGKLLYVCQGYDRSWKVV